MEIVLSISFLILGLLIGSFTNVIIYRTPIGLSIVKPNSRCGHCETEIKPYDNIPVLSYIFLKGKCRTCKTKISFRYPFVELLTGILYMLAYLWFGLTFDFLLSMIFITTGISIIFIDLDHKIILDRFNLIILGLGVAKIIELFINQDTTGVVLKLIGMFAALTIFLLIRRVGFLVYKKEALGFGDVKLMAAAGLYLGIGNILLTILFSSVIASIVILSLINMKKIKKEAEIPFAPFLVIGMFIALAFGNQLIQWYTSLF